MPKPLIHIFCLLLGISSVSAQVLFTKLPQHMQMFPRLHNNYGECRVKGTALQPLSILSVLSEHSTGNEQEKIGYTLNKNESFTIIHQIPAKLCEYDLTIYTCEKDSSWKKVTTIKNLVAGDFFIVNGQSNAESGSGQGGAEHDSIYFSAFNRAIGGNINLSTSMTPDSLPLVSMDYDLLFGRPHSYYWSDSTRAYSGLWPIKLQHALSLATGIPNCVVNGSRGGSPIADFYASHTPSIPDSLQHSPDYKLQKGFYLYDRLYKKLYENNAVEGVKAIFWYQGETDGSFARDSAAHYQARFSRLYASWIADFPNIEKVIVLQLNTGCSMENSGLIREIQRRMPDHCDKVVVMSTVGSPESDRQTDLCHYTVEGHSRIADKLIPLAKKYIYDFPLDEKIILPANIRSVYYTSTTRLVIEFDKEIVCQDSTWYESAQKSLYLKNSFFDEDYKPARVMAAYAENEKLILDMKSGVTLIKKLTYLPHAFSNLPTLYAGPWIVSANNPLLGAYSFFEYPVDLSHLSSPGYQPDKLRISPNPATNELTVHISTTMKYEYELVDAMGVVVLTGTLDHSQSKINVTELSRGVYFLKLRNNDFYQIKKIVLN